MAGKYYAVRRGRKPGIYRTWDECKAQVIGFSGAEYKSFTAQNSAAEYMGEEYSAKYMAAVEESDGSVIEPEQTDYVKTDAYGINEDNADKVNNMVMAYVDGSYNKTTKEFSYGMVILRDGGELFFSEKYNDSELAAMRNVAGEIKGAEAAMHYAVSEGLDSIRIYHDYEGIAKWCLGEWKTNKEGTKAYKEYYDSIKNDVSVKFVKVAAHTGDKYNEIADKLAKGALGL